MLIIKSLEGTWKRRLDMLFFLDTAELKEVKELIETGMVDGITTNPSLAASQESHFVN